MRPGSRETSVARIWLRCVAVFEKWEYTARTYCNYRHALLLSKAGTMKLAVIADTHMPRCAKALPRALIEGFESAHVDCILHLGDLTTPDVADMLRRYAPVDVVAGNNDNEEVRRRFPRQKIIDVDGVRIGMVHGDARNKPALACAQAAFSGDEVDVIAFGHSHKPYCEKHGGVWLLNPGSPTDKRTNPFFSFAIIEISHGRVTPKLIFYTSKA